MTDKRSDSGSVSARPPMPSIAPPTDDIDSEWGAEEELPAPARVPQMAATMPATPAARLSGVAAESTPAPRASVPAPRPSSPPAAPRIPTPIPRPSSAPRAASPSTPPPLPLQVAAPAPGNFRKQTLLGISPPVIAPRSQPPATATPAPDAPAPVATATPAPSLGQPLTLSSTNPLRKQTLLGIAPVLPAAAAATEPSSVPSIATPAAVLATDAPTSSDVAPAPAATLEETKPRRAPAPAALNISHDDLPELKPRRPRWVAPLGVAAVLALGVVGLRQLDRAPTEPPIPAVKTAPAKPAAAARANPKSDDDDDDDDPNTGTEPPPDPTPSEPDPLKAKVDGAKTAPPSAASAPAPSAAPAPDAVASAATPSGDTVRINVDSDPPGARLFWKGKEVGTTPFVLELKTGEKHAYELGLTGYTTRKVVIDGSKTDISIGLKPDPGTFIGASSRK